MIIVRGSHSITVNGQKVNAKPDKDVKFCLIPIVNGEQTEQKFECPSDSTFRVEVQGRACRIQTMSGDVVVNGSISGSASTMSGNVTVTGDIMGAATTMSGSINAGSL